MTTTTNLLNNMFNLFIQKPTEPQNLKWVKNVYEALGIDTDIQWKHLTDIQCEHWATIEYVFTIALISDSFDRYNPPEYEGNGQCVKILKDSLHHKICQVWNNSLTLEENWIEYLKIRARYKKTFLGIVENFINKQS